MCYQLLLQKGDGELRLIVLQSIYIYGELSTFVLFVLSLDTSVEVHLLLFYFDLQQIRYFIIFYLLSSQNFSHLTHFESIPL